MNKPVYINILRDFKYYNNLGFHNKYCQYNDIGKIYNSFEEFISNNSCKELFIDPIAICEHIGCFYFLGDRTIITQLKRSPWMAKPNKRKDDWDYYSIPLHGNKVFLENDIADTIISLLKKEILEYIGKRKNIGILLSGGMDSRIAAALLYSINNEEKLNLNIVAITWGTSNSRDVIYAREISKLYKWDFTYFPLTPELLFKNIYITAKLGCEFAPQHLHAMSEIRNMDGIECIIAASFGDSMGRGEYSGVHFSKLGPLTSLLKNHFSIIYGKVYKENISRAKDDIIDYHNIYKRERNYQIYEIERLSHYMRRELNSCMSHVNERIPTYQLFGSPDSYSYIWSLDSKVRGDKIYYFILKSVDKRLLDIPWARTGKKYYGNNLIMDSYNKSNNLYGKWVREELSSDLERLIFNPALERLNIFNITILKYLFNINKNFAKNPDSSRLDQIFLWLASLSILSAKHNLKSAYESRKNMNLNIKGKTKGIAYILYKNLIKGK